MEGPLKISYYWRATLLKYVKWNEMKCCLADPASYTCASIMLLHLTVIICCSHYANMQLCKSEEIGRFWMCYSSQAVCPVRPRITLGVPRVPLLFIVERIFQFLCAFGLKWPSSDVTSFASPSSALFRHFMTYIFILMYLSLYIYI